MWDKLKSTCELSDLSSQVSVFHKLSSLSLPEGGSVIEFLEEFQGTVDDAAVAGLITPDPQLVIILLGALPETWRAFISVLTNQTNITFPIIIGRILQENSMHSHKDIKEDKGKANIFEPGALMALPTSNNFQGNDRIAPSTSSSSPNKYKELTCHYCNKRGHIQPDCRSRTKDRANGIFKSVKPPTLAHFADPTGTVHLFNVTTLTGVTTSLNFASTWFLDSGATWHMTPHKHWLVQYELLTPPHISQF